MTDQPTPTPFVDRRTIHVDHNPQTGDTTVTVTETWNDGETTVRVMGDAEAAAWLKTNT